MVFTEMKPKNTSHTRKPTFPPRVTALTPEMLKSNVESLITTVLRAFREIRLMATSTSYSTICFPVITFLFSLFIAFVILLPSAMFPCFMSLSYPGKVKASSKEGKEMFKNAFSSSEAWPGS